MDRNHLRPVAPGEVIEEAEAPQPAHEVARRLLVEAEELARREYLGDPHDIVMAELSLPERAQALATIALGWATLALTEPRE